VSDRNLLARWTDHIRILFGAEKAIQKGYKNVCLDLTMLTHVVSKKLLSIEVFESFACRCGS
jgi:hypothetical protein